MKILFIDNNIDRHTAHKNILKQYPLVEYTLMEKATIEFIKENNFDIYIVHKGNQIELAEILNNKLGKERIIFSGIEHNPGKTERGIYTDDKELLYKALAETIIHFEEIRLEIKYFDNNMPRKEVNYIESIQSITGQSEIDEIIIPLEIIDTDYNCEVMIKQIRTEKDKRISQTMILVDCSETEFLGLLENSNAKNFLYVECLNDENLNNAESPSEIEWKKVYTYIANEPKKPNSTRHDQANKWGIYRLHRFLKNVGVESNNYSIIKNAMCNNDIFFKKIINSEDSCNDIPSEVKKLHEKIKNAELNIALVDDLANEGWKDVFRVLLKKSKIDSFTSVKDFEKIKKNWDNYDIVLLDLRLENKTKKSLYQLSGNILLSKIKNLYPGLPVIIVTASNKYNNLRDSINNGANQYWVKESHQIEITNEYNYTNSFQLLKSVNHCIEWNKIERPIINYLNKIEKKVSDISVEKGIKRRKSFIIAQLYNNYSEFLEKKLANTVLESAFIAAYSILNEIENDHFIEEEFVDEGEDDVYEDIKDPNKKIIKFYDYKTKYRLGILFWNGKKKERFIKLDEVVFNELDVKKNRIPYNDQFKMNYLIDKKQPALKNKYQKLRKKRNKLSLTHGNYDENSKQLVKYEDILELVMLINNLL